MKFIFSRKGFDAENGGIASPIMPNGRMFSMPIPSYDDITYSDLYCDNMSFRMVLDELKPNNPKLTSAYCHLDPDIRTDIRSYTPENWKPIFGQSGSAQGHLENQGVTVGDVFLFFGWFKETEYKDGKLKYKRGAKDLHVLYGYLQVGEIAKNNDVDKYPWHPHSFRLSNGCDDNNNTMYIASERLTIDGIETDFPGSGVFKYSEDLVLTMPGQTKSRWKLPEFFKEVDISCHNKDSFKPEGYFQTVRIGQEFVVSEDARVTEWAKDLITNHARPMFSGFDAPVKGEVVSTSEFLKSCAKATATKPKKTAKKKKSGVSPELRTALDRIIQEEAEVMFEEMNDYFEFNENLDLDS